MTFPVAARAGVSRTIRVSPVAKATATFERDQARNIHALLVAVKDGKAEEARILVKNLHQSAFSTTHVHGFTISAKGLSDEQESHLRSLWLGVNGTRGGRRITLNLER